MDDTLEAHLTRGSQGSHARGSRDPVAHPVGTSIAQRTAPDLVLWMDESGGFLEPVQEGSKARGKSVPNWSKSGREGCARAFVLSVFFFFRLFLVFWVSFFFFSFFFV